MKAKKFSAAGFIVGVLMLGTYITFINVRIEVIINDYIYSANTATANYQVIYNITEDQASNLLNTHLIYAAVWVVLFGTFFMLGTVFTNFYIGRLISYYANQKKERGSGKSWRIIEIFGVVWSLQFLVSYLLPWNIGLILHGILIALFVLVILSLSKDNLKEVRFKSQFALKNVKNDMKTNNGKNFERIVQISMVLCLITFGIFWFEATYYYSYSKEWYDWGFYIGLGLVILIFPLFSLLYCKTPVGQWVLKKCFLVISLIGMFYFALSIFGYSDILTNYIYTIFFAEKVNYSVNSPGFAFIPAQIILLFLLFFTCIVSLLGLKHGLLPTTNSDRRKRREYLNVKNMSKPGKVFLIVLCALIGFSIISYNGLGASVRLTNDANFSPRISFWEWDGEWDDHDNATLDKLNQYNMSLYGGYGRDIAYKTRMEWYWDRNISVYATGDNYEWIEWIETERAGGWDKCPVEGFIEDIENGGGLFDFNRSRNEQARADHEELIDYVHKHNMTQSFTAMHSTINDQRDGDLDVSIFNKIHSVPPLDWDSWNWMIYRTEGATSYEEKSPYFTYIWVKEMKNTFNLIYGDRYDNKLSVSLGVTEEKRDLYGAEDGMNQLLWDLRICDALKIPEVIIFVLNNVNSSNFMGLWGIEGFDIIAEGINNWTTLDLAYSRSATFLGNIKYLENPTGSVFGNFWLDIFLDNGIIYLVVIWISLLSITYGIYLKEIVQINKPREIIIT